MLERRQITRFLVVLSLCLFGLLACNRNKGQVAPKYPNCSSDYNCAHKQEHCVKQQCRQCGADEHCSPCHKCDKSQYACVLKKANCCANDLDCKAGGKCTNKGKDGTGTCTAPPKPPTSKPSTNK